MIKINVEDRLSALVKALRVWNYIVGNPGSDKEDAYDNLGLDSDTEECPCCDLIEETLGGYGSGYDCQDHCPAVWNFESENKRRCTETGSTFVKWDDYKRSKQAPDLARDVVKSLRLGIQGLMPELDRLVDRNGATISGGDTVLIAEVGKSYDGWENSWNKAMDEYVGKEVVLNPGSERRVSGILTNPFSGASHNRHYYFPAFVMERVEKKKVEVRPLYVHNCYIASGRSSWLMLKMVDGQYRWMVMDSAKDASYQRDKFSTVEAAWRWADGRGYVIHASKRFGDGNQWLVTKEMVR